MAEMKDEILYDTRLQERHTRRGVLSRKDLEKHLKELPDVSAQGELLVLDADNDIVVKGGAKPDAGAKDGGSST
ncbi:MAG: hypothetical protein HY903_07990 [Deltaproteobacteria bacterium]|nr:hypothetical protein [Deltaproteobacteria bacterium]